MASSIINSIGLFIDGNYFVLLDKGLGDSSSFRRPLPKNMS